MYFGEIVFFRGRGVDSRQQYEIHDDSNETFYMDRVSDFRDTGSLPPIWGTGTFCPLDEQMRGPWLSDV